jgi:hypothetical protein
MYGDHIKFVNVYYYSWFVKFDWFNDFDLTPFTAIQIDLIAPKGSDFNITLTQWVPAVPGVRDGKGSRGIDSAYYLLSSYLTPNGTPQTLTMPLSGFATNLKGGPFNFAHLKDLTLVNFGPKDTVFTFTKIVLIGNCSSSNALASTTSTGVVATGTAGLGAVTTSAAVSTLTTTASATTTKTSAAQRGVALEMLGSMILGGLMMVYGA